MSMGFQIGCRLLSRIKVQVSVAWAGHRTGMRLGVGRAYTCIQAVSVESTNGGIIV